MICGNCKKAGKAASKGLPAGVVVSLHNRCEYPAGCCCQHQLPYDYTRRKVKGNEH